MLFFIEKDFLQPGNTQGTILLRVLLFLRSKYSAYLNFEIDQKECWRTSLWGWDLHVCSQGGLCDYDFEKIHSRMYSLGKRIAGREDLGRIASTLWVLDAMPRVCRIRLGGEGRSKSRAVDRNFKMPGYDIKIIPTWLARRSLQRHNQLQTSITHDGAGGTV